MYPPIPRLLREQFGIESDKALKAYTKHFERTDNFTQDAHAIGVSETQMLSELGVNAEDFLIATGRVVPRDPTTHKPNALSRLLSHFRI